MPLLGLDQFAGQFDLLLSAADLTIQAGCQKLLADSAEERAWFESELLEAVAIQFAMNMPQGCDEM